MVHAADICLTPPAKGASASAGRTPADLGNCVLFHDLPPDALADVSRAASLKRAPKSATIFEQDAPANRLFVLIEGRVKAVQSTPDGQQVTARFLRAGDPIGCVALMREDRYPVAAIAETECRLASWEASTISRLAQQHPRILTNALVYVGAQLRETQSRLREAVTERAERRIAHALLRLVQQAGRQTAEGIEIGFPVSRQDIAEITGSRLFTVSRTMSKWESLGIVKSGRRHITIRAPHRLLTLAEDG